MSAEALSGQAQLFPLRDAYQYDVLGQERAAWGNEALPNPPYGAVFTYFLAEPPNDETKLVLTITEMKGEQVRRLELPNGTGIQRIAWDLRKDPPPPGEGEAEEQAGGRGRGGEDREGPPVEPGRYRAKLGMMSGETVTPLGKSQTFSVIPLPR